MRSGGASLLAKRTSKSCNPCASSPTALKTGSKSDGSAKSAESGSPTTASLVVRARARSAAEAWAMRTGVDTLTSMHSHPAVSIPETQETASSFLLTLLSASTFLEIGARSKWPPKDWF